MRLFEPKEEPIGYILVQGKTFELYKTNKQLILKATPHNATPEALLEEFEYEDWTSGSKVQHTPVKEEEAKVVEAEVVKPYFEEPNPENTVVTEDAPAEAEEGVEEEETEEVEEEAEESEEELKNV